MRIKPSDTKQKINTAFHFNEQVKAMKQISIRNMAQADLLEIWESFDQLHFYTAKSLHIMDLLIHCIDEMKPCQVWLTSFSLTNHVVDQLNMMYQNGMITQLSLMIDWRVKLSRPDLVYRISQIADDVILNDNHSKLILISNSSKACYSIVSSANLNNNPRNEAGVISRDPGVFHFYKNIFENESIKYHESY
jgi:hypothetical protein